MTATLLMDVHVRLEITEELRRRGIDVLTAQEDGAAEVEDAELLDRATALDRVLFSQDEDLLVDAVRRQRMAIPFATVIYAHQLRVSVGKCIEDLELFAKASTPAERRHRIIYLPLR